MRARHFSVGVVMAAVLALAVPHRSIPWLVWNSTASAPRGLYWVHHTSTIWRGAWMLVTPPPLVADMAATRGYLPRGVPLLKRIAAVPGDRVCALADQIRINDKDVAHRLARDGRGLVLPRWGGCRVLHDHQEFLLNPAPASFDGRYFGPVSTNFNLGRLEALWTF